MEGGDPDDLSPKKHDHDSFTELAVLNSQPKPLGSKVQVMDRPLPGL